jgi:FAD synthetase
MSFAESTSLDAKNSTISSGKKSKITVMCFGTFDIFHPWHQYYLSEAAKLGTQLIVVIARDHRVISGKWKTPIHSENERLQNVANTFPDAIVILGDEHDIFAPLRQYNQLCPEFSCFR